MSKTEFNQELSSAKANADYLLKTEDDLITGILSFQQGLNLNSYIDDLQAYLFTMADIIGFIGENDPNAKIYASTEYVANGDSRKVCIEKLDAQTFINEGNIANNLVLITDNTASIVAILDSVGEPDGLCPLDPSGKIPSIFLPDVLLEYKGIWDASTNTPTLADGTGSLNDWYRVDVAGTVDLGSGSETFAVGDKVVHNGTIWEKWDTVESVTSVNGQLGAVVLDKTDVGLTNVTDDAQLKRTGGDWGLFTEKTSPADDDIVLIEDSEDSGSKKTVKLLNLLGSGGGGGGSFAWSLSEDISPYESVEGGIEVLDFDFESGMAVSALIVVPEGYISGRQIALENGLFFSADTQDNVFFRAESTLFKVGDDITSPVHTYLSTNTENTLSTANAIESIGALEITDASGNINGQAVGSGDIIKIKLFRDNTNETISSIEDARFLKYSTNVNLDYEAPEVIAPIALAWDEAFNGSSELTISTTTASNDTIVKTSGSNNFFGNMVRTVGSIASGDGYIEGVASGSFPTLGLTSLALPTNGTLDQSVVQAATDFGAYKVSTSLYWTKNNTTGQIAGLTLIAGDVIRLEVIGSDVVIKVNNTIEYTFPAGAINYPLYGTFHARNLNDKYENIIFTDL